jgi:hypothetical protein
MASRSSEPKKASSSNFVLIFLLVLVASALIGWSAYWYVTSQKAQAALAAWTQREAQAGRNWSCPNPQVGGFPFAVQITCTNAAFQGELVDHKVTGTLREFRASAPLMQPGIINAELGPPFIAKSSDGAVDLTAHWEQLFFEFEGKPEELDRVALIGDKVTLKGTIAGVDLGNGTVGRFNTYAVRLPGQNDNAFEFLLALNDTTIPSLSEQFHLSPSLSLALGGTITQANFSGKGSFADKVDAWRNAQGVINLKTVRLTSGTQKFDAHGELSLDDQRRVRGELEAEFANLNDMLQQLGFDPMLVTAGSVLTNIFGNQQKVRGELLGGGRLRLPLAFSDGRLSIGSIKTSVELPPLY